MIINSQKPNLFDVVIILLILTPIGVFFAPFTGLIKSPVLNGFEAFLLLGLPVIVGISLSWWLAKKQKKKLAWFCLICGLLPIGYLFIVLLGIQMRWWNE